MEPCRSWSRATCPGILGDKWLVFRVRGMDTRSDSAHRRLLLTVNKPRGRARTIGITLPNRYSRTSICSGRNRFRGANENARG